VQRNAKPGVRFWVGLGGGLQVLKLLNVLGSLSKLGIDLSYCMRRHREKRCCF
jgi:hypothetical protein